jgi:hypothetical protein
LLGFAGGCVVAVPDTDDAGVRTTSTRRLVVNLFKSEMDHVVGVWNKDAIFVYDSNSNRGYVTIGRELRSITLQHQPMRSP